MSLGQQSSLYLCVHVYTCPFCARALVWVCAAVVGSEGVWARLGATRSHPRAQQSLLVLYLLSVRLCLPVAELCLLLSRESGCRTPAWTWLISSPPTVSYTSSAR